MMDEYKLFIDALGPGPGPDQVLPLMGAHPNVDKISFTGSNARAERIARQIKTGTMMLIAGQRTYHAKKR